MPRACTSLLALALTIPVFLSSPGTELRADDHIDDLLGAGTEDLTPEAIFALMDKDGSGTVSGDELRAHKMGVFFKLDRNGDGKLSRDELPGLSDAEFQAMDQDGDGSISGFEFNQSRATAVEAMDLNGDGVVTLEEFKAYRIDTAQ